MGHGELILTFTDNKFVLQAPTPLVARPAGFIRQGSNNFITKDIKAAAHFRNHADSKAENVFKKLMLLDVALPLRVGLSPKDFDLFPFQVERGIPHILKSNRTYLAHQPGLGKSAQAICAVNSKPGKALIVVPSFLKTNWAREITKWSLTDFPSIAVVPETNNQATMNWDADYIIVSDAMLLKPWVRVGIGSKDFRYVFIDEGHRFKTPDAARTIALFGGVAPRFKSRGLIYNAEHVCILSGTPLLNRPIELWPMLYAMAPELIDFMSYQNFGFKYGGARQDERGHWTFLGSANEDDLNKRIMGRFMQRITKAEVLTELPEKIREVIVVSEDTRSLETKRMDKELRKHLKKNLGPPKELGDFARVRHENGLAKVAWVASFVDNILSGDNLEQVILFAHHRDVVEGLTKALHTFLPLTIYGGTPDKLRTQMQDAFQAGRRRLLIGNIDAMNLGLTLTKATRVVFAEYSWTPAGNEQCEDRAHRIGQKDSVFCQYIVFPNSIDEMILNSVLTKEERIEKVMR